MRDGLRLWRPTLTTDLSRGFGTAVHVSMATMPTSSTSDLTPATAAMLLATARLRQSRVTYDFQNEEPSPARAV